MAKRMRLVPGVLSATLAATMAMSAVPAHAQEPVRPLPARNAVEDVRQSTILDPTKLQSMSVEQLERLGDELRGNKETLQAIDCYEAALKKQPDSAVLYNKIGISYLTIREFKKSRKALERAVKLEKTYAEAYNNLGASYYFEGVVERKNARETERARHTGKIDKSIKLYKKALALSEENASFHKNLGTAYIDLKDFNRGFAEYRRAFELDPTIFERSSRIGIAAQMASPEDLAEYNYCMAKLYASTGDFERALAALGRAMEDGYKNIDRVYKDNEFTKLRGDERFTALMSKRPTAITQ